MFKEEEEGVALYYDSLLGDLYANKKKPKKYSRDATNLTSPLLLPLLLTITTTTSTMNQSTNQLCLKKVEFINI